MGRLFWLSPVLFAQPNHLPTPELLIYSVIPDPHGDVWAGTNKGLARINRRTLQIRNYTTEDGILADEFNRYHFVHLPDNRILMGGLEGITAFYPSQVRPDPFQPNVEITSLQINNNAVRRVATAGA
ncbi:hypothetical protein [Larkinella rosea]|uniref:Uncharacterized protein n=1 Tax=Larkinella rosea TaxID=2025312 RepID=A0A3P1C358_9BACT|nr:hypothetical protein [Larkinella rosea]RRB07825.1 hypothetical protein EHT25_08635 [Larkinella rosea]